VASSALAVLVMHGPAWALREMFDLSAATYMTLAHALYFAVPLILWLVLRAIERDRLFSRLYIVAVMPMLYFPTELIFGVGVWLIWFALVSDRVRSIAEVGLATLLLGAVMAFSHPALALMGLFFEIAGLALPIFGRRLPMRTHCAVAALTAGLLIVYFATERWLPATNSTDGAMQQANRLAYINPAWMLKTIAYFPMLAALWGLLLIPAFGTFQRHWRFMTVVTVAIAMIGLWFAASGTGLKTSPWARHTGPYVVMLALVFGLTARAQWLLFAERPLMFFAAICAVSAVSFNLDIWLFGRFLDRQLKPGVVEAATLPHTWPSRRPEFVSRTVFKYGAGEDYVRDVVMPTYDWSRIPLSFYSYFSSDRQTVIFHPVGNGADWLPFECTSVGRALNHARDTQDRMFLTFLRQNYCAPSN
jgi:hypothetical protein